MRDSGVLLRKVSSNLGSRASAGLEPYSSLDMKPASLGEPEKEAVQLEGRGAPLSGQEDTFPRPLEAMGGVGDRGMDMDLLCWREEDSNVRQGRMEIVWDLVRRVLRTPGLRGLPVTDMGRAMVPSPSLAVRIRHEENLLTGEVMAAMSVRDRRGSPVWLGGGWWFRCLRVGTEMGLVPDDWLLLRGRNSDSSFMAFIASRIVSWMFCATTESSACIQNSPGPVVAERPTSMKKKLSE